MQSTIEFVDASLEGYPSKTGRERFVQRNLCTLL